MDQNYWAVAQTVPKMEHIVRREIEKTNHGAFVPTYARHWFVDGRRYARESPLFTGYVFFLTGSDWAGIPDIHGVYRVLASRVSPDEMMASPVHLEEMKRLVIEHACGEHSHFAGARYTRYYRPPTKKAARYRRRRPRPGKQYRGEARVA